MPMTPSAPAAAPEPTTEETMHVLIAPTNEGWIAQGVEVDYSTTGEMLEDVRRRFRVGLARTAEAAMKKVGHARTILEHPESITRRILVEFFRNNVRTETRLVRCDSKEIAVPFTVDLPKAGLPFKAIRYITLFPN